MISFDEAIELIRSVARPLGTERVALDQAGGRVLAAPVVARIDSPRSDVSSMDGYAVRNEDLDGFPVSLKIVGESFAGVPWQGIIETGTCARIFTGGAVPAGADRIVIQENVQREGDFAIISEVPGAQQYIRRRGGDFETGDVLLSDGRLLDERAIVAAAAADLADVEVYRRPRIQVFSTGDELAEPGTARDRPDAIPDSVSLGVTMLSERWGAVCVGRDRLRDDLSSMQQTAKTALERADLIVVTGGASVGERDFAKAMFEPAGLSLIFSKLAIKPGKPAWFGRVGEKFAVGLPGNPTSALVTGRLLLAPLIAGLVGRSVDSPLQWTSVGLATALPNCDARETFHRACLRDGRAEVLPFQESSAQRALADADILVRQKANSPAIPAGEIVEVLRL
jgi:molybdopterin molybdotransferase